MKHHYIRQRSRAYTLVETLIVLAIILTIAGFLGVPMYQRAQVQSQVTNASNAIAAVKSALTLYTQQSDGQAFPINFGQSGNPPVTGTLGGANSFNVIDLQTVLLSAKCLEAPVSVALGETRTPDLTTPVQWNSTTQSFFTTGDAAPTAVYRDPTTGIALYPRVICIMAFGNGAVTMNPSGTRLYNVTADGVTYPPDGTRLVFWVFAKVPANTAYELAKQLNKGLTIAPSGSAQTIGRIMYPGAAADGTTFVYAHVATL